MFIGKKRNTIQLNFTYKKAGKGEDLKKLLKNTKACDIFVTLWVK